METLRLPQRPHTYTSIRSAGTTTSQPPDVIVEEDTGDSVQVTSRLIVRILHNCSLFCVCVARSVISAILPIALPNGNYVVIIINPTFY